MALQFAGLMARPNESSAVKNGRGVLRVVLPHGSAYGDSFRLAIRITSQITGINLTTAKDETVIYFQDTNALLTKPDPGGR